MKQSTKLLSLLLALIMAFSCMSVIGNAALEFDEINYDNIDVVYSLLNPFNSKINT